MKRPATCSEEGSIDSNVAGVSSCRPPPPSLSAVAPSRPSPSAKDGTCSENPSLLNDALIAASCREHGITFVTKDGDFKRLGPFVKGFRYAAPWPMADNAGE